MRVLKLLAARLRARGLRVHLPSCRGPGPVLVPGKPVSRATVHGTVAPLVRRRPRRPQADRRPRQLGRGRGAVVAPRGSPRLPSAYGLARYRLPRRVTLRALITAPLMVSYLIIGMGLLIMFNALGVANRCCGRHRPRRDQFATVLRHHLFADGRPSAECRARRPRPRRAQLAGARARARPDALAGAVRELLPGDDLLGRVRDRLPAHPVRNHAAGRDLEPPEVRPQPQDQCRRLAGVRCRSSSS